MRRAPTEIRTRWRATGRLCRLACRRSFRRKQTPLSIRSFAITDDASRAVWWQVQGVTERFRGQAERGAVLKPEGEALSRSNCTRALVCSGRRRRWRMWSRQAVGTARSGWAERWWATAM
eukprot:2989312-Prymnesium_polylepis.1